MRHDTARGMYNQIEDALTSITMQLRSAISADVNISRDTWGSVSGARPLFHGDSGWARQVTGELGSVLLYTLGLPATIEWHLQQFQKCTSILCELSVKVTEAFDLPEELTLVVFDIYSEAMSNIALHAGASRIEVSLAIMPHQVTLLVRDNGVGLDANSSRTSRGGIADMRSRVRNNKGQCEIAGGNTGTTVTVSLPIARSS